MSMGYVEKIEKKEAFQLPYGISTVTSRNQL